MPFCGRASWWAKGAFVLLFPAIAIHCAGIGTPYWMKTSTISNTVNVSIGLWQIVNCSGSLSSPCVGAAMPASYKTNLLTVTQVLECKVLLYMTLAFTLSFFYVTSPGARTQKVAGWVMVLSFTSLASIIAGMITWTLNLPANHYVYWSMGLTLLSGAFSMLVAVLMIPDIRMFDYEGARLKSEARREKKELKKKLKDMY